MFEERILELSGSVVKPLWEKVLSLSWPARAFTLVLCLLGGGAIKYPDIAQSLYLHGSYLVEAARSSGTGIPLRTDLIDALRDADSRLSKSVSADLLKRDDVSTSAWATAQALVALHGTGDAGADPNDIVTFIRSRKAKNCACWTETVATTQPCTFISGWIMAAFADLKVKVSPDELDDVLSKQDTRDGWWPTSTAASQVEYASTYSTAWVLIGLVAQLKRGFIDSSHAKAVRQAIFRGATWLMEVRRPHARWRPYPNLPAGADSESISGVVMHALHVSRIVDTRELDKEWLDNLPDRHILASETDQSTYTDLRGMKEDFVDHFAYLTLPWTVVATDEAYGHGDIWEKAKAVGWLERIVSDQSVLTADANDNNWWRAEVLFAIRDVLGHV